MEHLFEELGIPRKYLKTTTSEDRFIALVHRSWLKSLLKYSKLLDFVEKSKLEAWSDSDKDLGVGWVKVFISVFKKREANALALPRIRSTTSTSNDVPLLFSQLMQYISLTNFKNLWKEAYKKYSSASDSLKDTQMTLVEYNEVLREIILRIYGCGLINTCNSSLSTSASNNYDAHSNIFQAVCAVETLNAVFVIHRSFLPHNLMDCVTFSPAILNKTYKKPLFIIYQLLECVKSLHDRSLTIGEITLNDIYISENLWIQVFPQLLSNIHIQKSESKKFSAGNFDCWKLGHKYDSSLKCVGCGSRTYDRVTVRNQSLEQLCQLWVDGYISNFTYISALNKLSGRKYGDPHCHYVFPWVTDFSSRCGKNWRELKKSKYRLNKGDRQLDLTYEHSHTQVPHHVSDVLSPITYYVYMARRTPRSVLCKNVRTVWVPAEYPSSIQRMQEWTPDECIPEFFSNPTVFKSMHDDLDDLEVPGWCSGPEDFVRQHREALESAYVSEKLHHWLDLTFGYKLSGNAAVKAKNVCLQLVDDHTNLTKSGVVQLFTQPHPPRAVRSPFWSKTPPKIYVHKSKHRTREHSTSSSLSIEASRSEEDLSCDESSPLAPSRSRQSLHEEHKSLGPKNPTFTSHVTARPLNRLSIQKPSLSTGTIYLPKEYNPSLALTNLENRYGFVSRTFHSDRNKVEAQQEPLKANEEVEDMVQNAFTNRLFEGKIKSHTFPIDGHNPFFYPKNNKAVENIDKTVSCDYSQIITARRTKELQIIGCLIVELFMAKQLRTLGDCGTKTSGFSSRLSACLTAVKHCRHEMPLCIQYITELLLQPDKATLTSFEYSTVTNYGLPPPSAHLLLEPLLHCVIPFPKPFHKTYALLKALNGFTSVYHELTIMYHFDCDGKMCHEYENLERTKILLAQNIGDCKVKNTARELDDLLGDLNINTDLEIVYIILPHIKELLLEPSTSVLAAWYLFDPIARALGPQKAGETLLESLLKLYETEPNETTVPYHGKIAKLYHHSFLLRLIVWLGLKCFLENFVTLLIEAVGGYRNNEKVDFVLHTHTEKIVRKTSNLRSIECEQSELSPSDDSSSHSSSEKTQHNQSSSSTAIAEPEVFEFENDDDQCYQSLIEHLELNVASDLPFNHSTAEEALDATLSESIEQLRSLEELKINLDDAPEPVTSPTIPIPQTKELINISCDVGSKKSDFESIESASLGKANSSTRRNEVKISDMSSDSLIWLSHRLGPVLTARYLSRNLLKMLTLCYVGRDNLVACSQEGAEFIGIASSRVVGDQNSARVLDCLASIAGLYGEQFILVQYFPHMSELIASCKKRLTPNLEGALISCLALLQHVIPYLCDTTLMDHLQDGILKSILHPIVRLLGSVRYTFPNGSAARDVLARKYLDALYVLCLRMGAHMSRTHLAVPALQRFFLIFDKASGIGSFGTTEEPTPNSKSLGNDSHFVEVRRDGTTAEWSISGTPVQISHIKDGKSADSISPPISFKETETDCNESTAQGLVELRSVFTPELAHTAYVPFLRQIGLDSLEISLKNHARIRYLCTEYEREMQASFSNMAPNLQLVDYSSNKDGCGSIGSNVAVVGNRIDVQLTEESADARSVDVLSLISNKMENTARHLRGNWLAYWEHEIGRWEKDTLFNFKQIRLQSFCGHVNSIKCLHVLDNENSFMSGSRDKTVKLWSVRSQGDGTGVSNCQWTYTAHKKSVLTITFVESLRLVASCDSVVHIWDPFMGANVGHLESPKNPPVNVLKPMPAPSCLLFAATTEGSVRVIDTRLCSYIYELKINLMQASLIRCLAVSKSGNWLATGQSSGHITILDTRTGLVLSSWRAHEGEVLQLIAFDNDTVISSSLDQTISVWNVSDGKLWFHLRGATEPVHCLHLYNSELISGTTANRIGVHTSVHQDASFSSTKLRSDTFKGILTSMAILPLNRLLLLGADNGNISLLC